MSKLNVEDVLNPRLVWIGECCYRINRKKSATTTTNKNISDIPQQKMCYNDDDEPCEEYSNFEVEATEDGQFKTSIRIPQKFYAYIIGVKGSRRKQLESQTETKISIPRDAQNSEIVITGSTEHNVIQCRDRLEMIDVDLRNRHTITHFISFPLISDEIKANYKKFKELVLGEGHIDGVDESIFQKIDKVHLTIGTLILLDNYERETASNILEKCKTDIILPQLASGDPLIIKMKGLEYMNDDPSQVDVLYATVTVENHKNPNILQKISDDIVQYFQSKGIMKKEGDNVKLHATLINTRYRKDGENDQSGSRSRERKKGRRISFDARPILKKYSDFDFGEQQLDFIHLSHRFSVDKNGYYEPLHVISCC